MILSIKDIVLILWRRKVSLALFSVTGCIIAGMLGILLEKPMFTATASVYVYNGETRMNYNISTGELSASQRLVSTYIVVLKSNSVLNQVSDELVNYDLTAAEIRSMLSASDIDGTEAFSISITSTDQQMAQELCNTILQVAPKEIVRVVKAGSVEIIDWAELPETPSWDIRKYILLGGFLGFVGILSYILLRFMFDTTIYDDLILTENFNISIVGRIPREITETDERYCDEGKRSVR